MFAPTTGPRSSNTGAGRGVSAAMKRGKTFDVVTVSGTAGVAPAAEGSSAFRPLHLNNSANYRTSSPCRCGGLPRGRQHRRLAHRLGRRGRRRRARGRRHRGLVIVANVGRLAVVRLAVFDGRLAPEALHVDAASEVRPVSN